MSDQGGMGSTSNQARKAEATLTHPSARDRGTLLTVSPQAGHTASSIRRHLLWQVIRQRGDRHYAL